ncbi:hypothetical protein WISP_86905 [Willisornis vidua]|uniref:CCHC-type domain-containing protein n=1 Tax=Willisornis vidua TaxID=1566151 RepID=A0ABQ9D375_9PASS|nr:hypothetical protein WISP_86905 [Willisornis vidua]
MKPAGKMEAEFTAAEWLLSAILSKRGEAVSDKLLQKLIAWARGKGYFTTPSLLFLFEEWRAVGDKMWELTIKGKDKDFKDLRVSWRTIINVLESMKAESKVAAAAVQALSPVEQQPKRSCFACPVQTNNPLPMKGLSVRPCHTLAELIPEAPAPAPVLMPPRPDTALPAAASVPSAPPLDDGTAEPSRFSEEVGGPSCRPLPTDVPLPKDEGEINLNLIADELLKVMEKVDERGQRALERVERILREEASGVSTPIKDKPTLHEIIKGGVATESTKPRRWSGVVKDAILEGEWTPSLMACPIVREDNGEITYVRHEWKILQQLIKALRENGHKSETRRALINWLYTNDLNIPIDCAELVRLLLTPSQYLIWYREWERLAKEEENRLRRDDDPLAGIRADMITGSGLYTSAAEQARYPHILLEVVVRTGIRAFDAVPDASGTPSFTNIRQGLTEQYPHFIDRLHSAIQGSSQLAPENRESMFRLLAFENANNKTKAILAMLPKTADVSDMIELTLRAEQGQQAKNIAGAVAAAMQPTTTLVAAAVQKLQPNKGRANSPASVCYRCGRKGHFRKTCSATIDIGAGNETVMVELSHYSGTWVSAAVVDEKQFLVPTPVYQPLQDLKRDFYQKV